MTAYETVMVVLGILGLLTAFAALLSRCLPFWIKESVSKKMPILSDSQDGRCP